MELWDLYTENLELTGLTHVRGVPVPDGYYHLVVHAWIRNSEGKYLISRRAASRPAYPLYWECVGGSVIKGEDGLTGALRETEKEVGLCFKPEDANHLFSRVRKTHNGQIFNDILDVWLFTYDGLVSLENATTDEVCDLKWMTVEEIRALFDAGKLVPTLGYFFTDVAGR